MIVPLTVRIGDETVEIQVRSSGPTSWSDARPHVLRAAGLAPSTPLYLGVGEIEPDWMVGSPPLLCGAVVSTAPATTVPDRPLMVLAVVAGPDAGRGVPLPCGPLLVGRDPHAGLSLTDPQASYRHALLTPTTTGMAVTDLGSTNGVLVDGHPAPVNPDYHSDGVIGDPDEASGSAGARAVTGSLIRIGGTLLQIQLTAEPRGVQTPDGRGHLVRRPGVSARAPEPKPIPDDPGEPPQRQRRPLPLVAAILGAAVGAGLALVLASPAYLAFAALGPLTMLGTALSDRIGGRRSYRRQVRAYRAAVARRAAAIAAAAAAEARWAWDHWPDPATLLRRAEAGSARLWDRPPDSLRVAIGARRVPLRPPESGASGSAGSAADGTGPVGAGPDGTGPGGSGPATEVPVTIDLATVRALGLTGGTGRALARWLLAQLAALHPPGRLALVVLSAQPDLHPCRHLPHAIATADIAALTRSGARDLVAVLDGPGALSSTAGRALLAAAGSGTVTSRPADATAPPAGPRVHVLCLVEHADQLPPDCINAGAWASSSIDITGVGADLLARTCRALAPLQESAGRASDTPPPSVSLLDLVDVPTPQTLRENWRRPSPVGVLGATAQGVARLDIDADGPHLLVAGTTGSGKSELLLTLIASLAIASPPSWLTFLLIDYKGGAAFAAVAGLPHVVGTVTDLDPELSARALASLRAELRRRERLCATTAQLPRLVIVIDEFATLAAELPEFLSGIVDVAQRGRSLGLHLVLATQRPAGVVSPAMRANISARICLRVTDTADSIDVIGAPDAARLPPEAPGRALLRTGSGLITFQSALSTAPLEPAIQVRRLARWPDSGTEPLGDTVEPRADTAPALRGIVAAATAAAAGEPAPHRPWVPPLPTRYRPADDRSGFLAVADLPDQQARHELLLPATSVLVTGPPGSGRSTALRRIAAIAAARGSELLVVDAGSALADLARWPAVSSYLTLGQPHLVVRMAALLADPRRRPADGRIRWLLVDGYDLVAAALDRVDYVAGSAAIAELPTRSGGTVRLAVAGPPALEHHRQVGGFATVIALGATTAGSGGIAGRARWSGRTVQIADAPPGSSPAGDGGGPPPGADRTVVRPLPDLVTRTDLPTPRPEAVPLGIGGDASLPMTVDLGGAGGAIVVAGRRRCGVSTALLVIGDGAARAGIPVWSLGPPPTGRPNRAGITHLDTREGTGTLRDALATHTGPLLLVVDQEGAGDAHPAADLLERFCQVCGPGQYLLIGERTDEFARAHRGHLRAAMAFRRGLLLSPDTAAGALLDVSLPRHGGPLPPGRGVWAEAGVATPIQVACDRR